MTTIRDLYENLAIPYVAVLYPIQVDDRWISRAEYPELPACVATGDTAAQAIEQLEECRIRIIIEMHESGASPPRPRPPLITGLATHGAADIGALVEQLSVAG